MPTKPAQDIKKGDVLGDANTRMLVTGDAYIEDGRVVIPNATYGESKANINQMIPYHEDEN